MGEDLTPALGFLIFVVVSITTPGPNNIMTLHSGARFGIGRTLPLILGIQFGFALMIAIIAYGSAFVINRIENAENILRVVCFAYLMFLAWRIGTAPVPDLDAPQLDDARPIGLFEAALFQWVNPKAWAVAVAAVGTYSFLFSGLIGPVLGFAGTFLIIGLPSSFTWAAGGKLIGRVLRSPNHYRVFSVVSAIVMVAAVVPALLTL